MNPFLLFLLFAKIGIFTFGGGYAMIPLFQDELVTSRALMTPSEFANLIALAQVTPGPIGLNAATYIGMQQAGIPGALAGTLGISLPSLTVGLLVAFTLKKFQNNKFVAAAIYGIRPVTLGLIAAAIIFFAETSIFATPLDNLWTSGENFRICWQGTLIFALTIIISQIWQKINPIWLILGGAILGCLLR